MEALIKSVFKDEIEKEAVSVEDVRSKISNHPQLENEDPKRVLDKNKVTVAIQKASIDVHRSTCKSTL